jgi:hypothetical protein
MINKWYILSTPCQGKSFFVKKNNGKFLGYKIYDIDGLQKPNDYRVLNKVNENSIVLGGIYKPRNSPNCPLELSDIESSDNYLIVKIPYEKLLMNLDKRKKGSRKNCIWGWSELENVKKAYDDLDTIKNIPVFNSFESAIKYIKKNENN